jgi:poly-gamma-glutamate synthesis protein (capsule biosynthesis protein)
MRISPRTGDFVFRVLLVGLISSLGAVDLGARQGAEETKARQYPEHRADPAYPWIYLRGGEAPANSERLVEIALVGDVMLGRGVAAGGEVFGEVAAPLRNADLAVGNFEGAIPADLTPAGEDLIHGAGGTAPGVVESPGYAPYRLLAPVTALAQLRTAGFDLLALANNHALDAGEAGLANTAARLAGAGIIPLGVECDPVSFICAGSFQAVVRRSGGISIAFLAFNFIPLPDHTDGDSNKAGLILPASTTSLGKGSPDASPVLDAIRRARRVADIVVVLVHWGREYQLHPDPAQRELARIMVEAGADLIVGSHPHVAQEIEILPRQAGQYSQIGLAAYSLGNFVFDQGWGETGEGLALRAYLDSGGLRAVQALPVKAGPRPHWMVRGASTDLLARIAPPPARLGFTCKVQPCREVALPPGEGSGIFRSGGIDLTGDGASEIIRLEGGRALIYQGGELAWQSPAEWRVVDLALGDPNDDGRGELLLALSKDAPGGFETSHPFILGYRGGAYRVLWGGSAVSEPILEVELGDLDGDRVQELVALEGNAVSLWRWHGWGFALLWRSTSGSFRDLMLLPQENGSSVIAVVPDSLEPDR